jgi:ADP-ribose pyrophosphatase YjhB (NUDIX family)
MPDKPTKHSVAAALRRVDGLILAVKRPDEPGEELPNVWGLPAVTLLENETIEDGVRRLGAEKLGIELTPLRLLAEGTQQRDDYTLHMTVYEASPGGEPTLPARTPEATVTLYEDADWLPSEAFNEAAERGSLCCKLFLEAVSIEERLTRPEAP